MNPMDPETAILHRQVMDEIAQSHQVHVDVYTRWMTGAKAQAKLDAKRAKHGVSVHKAKKPEFMKDKDRHGKRTMSEIMRGEE